MKTKTIILTAMTVFALALTITAYAHGPRWDGQGGYSMGGNFYGMMDGRGMMGGNGSGGGMMHDYGHDDQNRYNRGTTDNYRRNHERYRYDRNSSDHYRDRSGYDRYNRETEDYNGPNFKSYRGNTYNYNSNMEPSGDESERN